MYKDFYKLSGDPFQLTPDPGFCFDHHDFDSARAYLRQALNQGEGIPMIVGRPGIGKTTLAEVFLAGLDPKSVVCANVVSTHQHLEDIPRVVAYAFNLDAEGRDQATLLNQLEQFFTQERRAGRRALLVVDEAQNLSASALEGLRLLTNFHMEHQALLQVFLLGHEKLLETVRGPQMEQLYQRLIACFRMVPLGLSDTHDYVVHRLARVGWRGDPHFSRQLFVLIQRYSQGIPRYINTLCGRLLLYGVLENKHALEVGDLAAVLQEMQDDFLLPAAAGGGSLGIGSNRQSLNGVIAWGDMVPGWESRLSDEEREFISQAEPLTGEGFPDLDLITAEPAGVITPEPVAEQVLPDIATRNLPDPVESISRAFSPPYGGLVKYGAVLLLLIVGLLVFVHEEVPTGDSETRTSLAGDGASRPTAATGTMEAPAGTGEGEESPEAVSDPAKSPGADALAVDGPMGKEPPDLVIDERVAPGLLLHEDTITTVAPQEIAGAADAGLTLHADDRGSGKTPVAVDAGTGLPASAGSSGGETRPEEQVEVSESGRASPSGHSAAGREATTTAAPPVTVPAIAREGMVQAPALAHKGGGAIPKLLQLAAQALKDDRLMVPRRRNALEYYRQILRLDPSNQAAEQGLQEIVTRYRELAQRSLKNGDHKAVRRYAGRGLKIEARDARLLTLERKAEQMAQREREVPAVILPAEEETPQDSVALDSTAEPPQEPDAIDSFLTNLKAFFSDAKQPGELEKPFLDGD